MRFLIPLLFVAVTLVDAMPRGPPQQGGMPPIDPGMRKAILDMIMSQIQRASPNTLQTMLGQLIGKYNSRPNHHHRPQGGNFGGFRPQAGPPSLPPPSASIPAPAPSQLRNASRKCFHATTAPSRTQAPTPHPPPTTG